MPDWITDHKTLLGWLVVLSVVTFVGSLIVIPMLVVHIPEDYFAERRHHRLAWWAEHPVLRWVVMGVKNVGGWLFILAGTVMLVLPGQGIITMVVGVMLIDFPGKFRLERWLAARRPLMRALNWMRRRAGRPPLQVPGNPPDNPATR